MIVYGFFYNSLTYESADAMMSLHLTKKGAYKAMRKHRVEHYLEETTHYDGTRKRGYRQWTLKWQEWKVLPVEIEE